MNANSLLLLFIAAIILSGILFFILALYKRYAYFWWTLAGVAICTPIAALIPKLEKIFFNLNTNENKITLFLVIYLLMYLSLWIFSKRNVMTAKQREKQEKINEAIFDGYFALKEKQIDRAYRIFKEASIIDPDNPVIKTVLSSFTAGQHGLIKKNSIFEWRLKILLYLKGIWRKNRDIIS